MAAAGLNVAGSIGCRCGEPVGCDGPVGGLNEPDGSVDADGLGESDASGEGWVTEPLEEATGVIGPDLVPCEACSATRSPVDVQAAHERAVTTTMLPQPL